MTPSIDYYRVGAVPKVSGSLAKPGSQDLEKSTSTWGVKCVSQTLSSYRNKMRGYKGFCILEGDV